MKIGVLGSGSWGAALSIVLHGNGHEVTIWSHSVDEADKIRKTRRLLHKLPEITLPTDIHITHDATELFHQTDLYLNTLPTKYIRTFAQKNSIYLSDKQKIVVNASKGMDAETLDTVSDIIDAEWKGKIAGVVALSGPSHAEEVARNLPTAIVAASPVEEYANLVQEIFQSPMFRVYTNPDRKGVEVGAALKNVIAIAVGISDGLGFGDNARAALISRGIQELSRAGKALGAMPETFAGLSGVGDLIVTCTSQHSRNRKLGELIAKGYSITEAEEEIGMVVEGLTSVKAVPKIKAKANEDLPILEEVYAIAEEQINPKQAVERLMLRESKAEW